MNKNLSPLCYVVSAVACLAIALYSFAHFGYHDRLFIVPIFALALLWAGANLWRQFRGNSEYRIERLSNPGKLLRRALIRYVVWGVIFLTGVEFLSTHSYYATNEKTLYFLRSFMQWYFILGLPYFMLTLTFKASHTADFFDPAIRLFLMGKYLFRGLLVPQARPRARRVFTRRYHRKVLLNLVMRVYFIPVMVIQVYNGFQLSVHGLSQGLPGGDLLTLLFWLTGVLWLVDSLAAATSYSIESRWTENHSRSIDLTTAGWTVCFACYPPLNEVTSTLFLFSPNVVGNSVQDLVFAHSTFFMALKVLEFTLLVALVYTDLSLGPSVANITFKRLQSRGPYALVRHPATTCKLTLWWMQSIFFIQFWSWDVIIGQVMWNVIYILRALTEERHLRQYAEYRQYMQKVPYRFIPGLI